MNRKGQVFPIERRALLKHAGLAAAGFAVMPLAACEAPNKLLQGSTGGSNPLAIPPLQVGRIEQGERVFRLLDLGPEGIRGWRRLTHDRH